MANFAGLDMGIVEEMNTFPNPRERQVNAYPGVNGTEPLDLGSRGGKTVARGVFAGSTPFDLASIQGAWYAVQFGGGAYVLLDSKGVAWTNVILEFVRPVGPTIPGVSGGGVAAGGVAQRYEMEFYHIG
jgi:hypothetical protein